ncbi:MAG: hypothetical protein LH468_02775 [Nocardioides sp.]|nr:hypothetical protein [Nocardioides sp.]
MPTGYAPGPGGVALTGIAVATSPVTDQDFVLRALPAVSGHVTGGGTGLCGVPITLTPDGGGPRLTAVTTGDGSYTFRGVDAGAVTLSIVAPPGDGGATSRPAIVAAATDLTSQDFDLTRPGAVAVTVSNADGGVSVVTVTINGPGGPVTAVTDGAGSYLLEGLAPGSYTVTPPAGDVVAGTATQSFTITSAGEIRGGLDYSLRASVVPPAPTATAQ